MLCKVQENAFVFKDEHSGLLEIIDSGLDESVGKKLLVSEDLVMKSMHSTAFIIHDKFPCGGSEAVFSIQYSVGSGGRAGGDNNRQVIAGQNENVTEKINTKDNF